MEGKIEKRARKPRAVRLADEHWSYIESTLRVHGESDEVIAKVRYHYKAAFVHGWKHANEDR